MAILGRPQRWPPPTTSRATWQLYDTETNSVIRNVTDGNRIDLHQVNRGNLALVASFTYKRSGDDLHDHTAWVDWTLTHSAAL